MATDPTLPGSPMIGVPPICQSADGNGGESNGAGGMRRCTGRAFESGASQAGDCKFFASASNNRRPNQPGSSAALAFDNTNAATSPTSASLNDLPSTQTKRHSRDEALHSAKSRFPRLPLPFNHADEVSCRARAIKCSRCRASFAPIRTAVAESELVPPLNRPPADPLSETKNSPNAENVFPDCRNQSYSAVSRLAELTSRSGTRVFDEPGPKRRGRLTTDC